MKHGSHIDPPNRFSKTYTAPDPEQLVGEEDYGSERAKRPIEYLPDDSQSSVSENESPDIPGVVDFGCGRQKEVQISQIRQPAGQMVRPLEQRHVPKTQRMVQNDQALVPLPAQDSEELKAVAEFR